MLSVPSAPVVADWGEYFKPFHNILSQKQYAHFYRVVMGLMVALGAHRVTDVTRLWCYVCHWTNVYAFLRTKAWEATDVARVLWKPSWENLGRPQRLFAVVDDTTVRHAGAKKMEWVRRHHNASAQNDPCRAQKIWGHQWVLLGLAVLLTSCHWEILPIAVQLVETGMNKLTLALGIIRQLEIPASVILTVIADGWYTKRPLVEGLAAMQMHYLGKTRRDARLYEPLPDMPAGAKRSSGRPRTKGRRIKPLELVQTFPDLISRSVVIRGHKRCVDIWQRIVVVAGWNGLRARLVIARWTNRRKHTRHLYLLCSDLSLSATEILRHYDARWMIEPCICDLKQKGGMASYGGRYARGHLAWAQLCCVARTLLVLLCMKIKGGLIDPWRRTTQPPYITVGQQRLAMTMNFNQLASFAQVDNNSGDSEISKCQRTKIR
jgi:hypothetical protein